MNVLVVDKDQLASRILVKKLESWGHIGFAAANAFEAERILERESIRLVITEIDLPGKSGTDLVKHVRDMGRPRYTYVIILTGNTETTELLAALEAGSDDLLRKPLNVFEMRLRIKAAKRLLNMEDELREGAGTDGTTGLVNMSSFRQFFRVIIAENRRTEATGALMFIHVTNYMKVRSDHGYKAAEYMMRAVGKSLGDIVRTADLASRLSDDTFGLCLQNTSWPTCRIVGEKAEARADATALVFEGIDLRPRLKIETVNFPQVDMEADEILESAPRIPFEGGEAVAPGDTGDTMVAADQPPAASVGGAPVAPGDMESGTVDILRRAGIDVASYAKLTEFEQQRVLKLAEQLAGASDA